MYGRSLLSPSLPRILAIGQQYQAELDGKHLHGFTGNSMILIDFVVTFIKKMNRN